MKKLIALLLTLSILVCFSACGGEETNPDNISGETYNAGNVSVLVPDGWKAFSVTDMWSEEENATNPDQVNIVKGGKTDLDLLSKPYIQVIHYEPGSMITPSKEFYQSANDVESITTGSLTWEGFSATGLLDSSMIIMWTTNADGHQFQINVYDKTNDGTITMKDADVQAILASIKIS